MLMRTIALELAPHKITVNNIAPGAIPTPIDLIVWANLMKSANWRSIWPPMLLPMSPVRRMSLREDS